MMTAQDLSAKLHAQLRLATKAAHHRLDHHPLLAPLVRGDLSAMQYGDALASLHGVHSVIETRLLAFLAANPGLFDYAARRKVAAIDADLRALHRSPLPVSVSLPSPDSVGALVGLLYTLEGATQGGQYIARNLHQLPPPQLPSTFFDGYGAHTAARWQEFWDFAQANCPSAEHTLAISSATAMFEAIGQHLDACLVLLKKTEPD